VIDEIAEIHTPPPFSAGITSGVLITAIGVLITAIGVLITATAIQVHVGTKSMCKIVVGACLHENNSTDPMQY